MPSLPLLQLSLTPGLGPILLSRCLESLGSPQAVLAAGETSLQSIKGIGPEKARTIAAGLRNSADIAHRELDLAHSLNVRIITIDEPAYPSLLKHTPSPPTALYILGSFEPQSADRYAVAIVGSRECSSYGLEQAARFSSALSQAGLTIVSGGARGIDTAAHQAALNARASGSRTLAVLGCGLAHRYPPENARLFASIIEHNSGCLISELPLNTAPAAENFPARNRIISGLSLGVLVIEAARKSGALITARLAVEDHNREVFALPGRVDSPYSQGSLDLIKLGGATLVTHPDDIIAGLESAGWHQFQGTHQPRYALENVRRNFDETKSARTTPIANFDLFASPTDKNLLPHVAAESVHSPARHSSEESTPSSAPLHTPPAPLPTQTLDSSLSPAQLTILATLDRALTFDELLARVQSEPSQLRTDLTILEVKRRVRRSGSRFEKTR